MESIIETLNCIYFNETGKNKYRVKPAAEALFLISMVFRLIQLLRACD